MHQTPLRPPSRTTSPLRATSPPRTGAASTSSRRASTRPRRACAASRASATSSLRALRSVYFPSTPSYQVIAPFSQPLPATVPCRRCRGRRSRRRVAALGCLDPARRASAQRRAARGRHAGRRRGRGSSAGGGQARLGRAIRARAPALARRLDGRGPPRHAGSKRRSAGPRTHRTRDTSCACLQRRIAAIQAERDVLAAQVSSLGAEVQVRLGRGRDTLCPGLLQWTQATPFLLPTAPLGRHV